MLLPKCVTHDKSKMISFVMTKVVGVMFLFVFKALFLHGNSLCEAV